MTNIHNHFAQPVKMSDVNNRTITRYVLNNSAGHTNHEVSNKILESLKYNPIPVRITETPYFKYIHKQTNQQMYKQKVVQCDYCHQEAIQGKYDKTKIHIPNL